MTLFGRRKKFVVNEPDLSQDVVYMGNVLTTLAKGDECLEKPLSMICHAYNSRASLDMRMKLTVTRSGLKAATREAGITEYWSHRITYCAAPKNFPKVFCWIYKHEGKKMKPELRCHAVLFSKSGSARVFAQLLRENLLIALKEYKRDRIHRQNSRISSAHTGHPSTPLRKQMLSIGGQHFRPPVNRSKSAPRLQCINEATEEELKNEEILSKLVFNSMIHDSELRSSDQSAQDTVPTRSYSTGDYASSEEKVTPEELLKSLNIRSHSLCSENDSYSDESGYIEEKISDDSEDEEQGESELQQNYPGQVYSISL
ncbi:unnamed protein product [Soboliphyme baturini]|uniref:PID domain-containing protein n=1 Tax=Soboliphyme baturini TaxID=241478 RepID=A0A183IEM2_9BILA|nr:unnamed protein product [Soboliphyme baturini]